MASLFFDYSVLDDGYTHGKVQSISGSAGAPSGLDNPEDTRIDDIAPYTDTDPEVFSYMDGTSQTTPRLLLCNVTTDFSTTPATSTGKYSAYTPVVPTPPSTRTWDWNLVGIKDIQLVNSSGNPVAGNPYGIVQAGNFLYVIEYDTGNIYTLNITNFEGASGSTYTVTTTTAVTPPSGYYAHGSAILSLTNGSITYLYGLFAIAEYAGGSSTPTSYNPSVLVQYRVNPSTGALVLLATVSVGPNATALVPAPNSIAGQDAMAILVPAIGDIQKYGTTNGTASVLSVVQAFGNFGKTAVRVAFTGDPIPSPAIFPAGNYDIKGVTVSADGAYVYLLTVTNSAAYTTFWRLYQTTAAKILGIASSETLSAAVTNGDLTVLDSTADTTNGDPGYYWEVQYENNATAANGRLWFVKGSPIRISLGSAYGTFKLFDAGSGGPLYSPSFNVNSADLIGETIYSASQNISKDTRLLKGNVAAQAAQAAAAAAAAAAAPEEEEEEK
jgi:hypothetical protein